MQLLQELLNMNPLPWKWIDDTFASFKNDDLNIVVGCEQAPMVMTDTGKELRVANLAFGVQTERGISTALTNKGNIRTVLKTVVDIFEDFIGKHRRVNAILLAAEGKNLDERYRVYSMALKEMSSKLEDYGFDYQHKIIDKPGTKILLVTQLKLNEREIDDISKMVSKMNDMRMPTE